ncbi:hypothetical protein CNMCM8980_006930 [Aspergillus fumigatiaffinis]|nr:hypothetical protein CNMCM8980_006930 [Aspergillus fumigatiaffinis]
MSFSVAQNIILPSGLRAIRSDSPFLLILCAPHPAGLRLFPWFSHMAKRNYRAWTPGEESDFEPWVALYPNLTWSERAEKYSMERKPRNAESLRAKFRQLKKNIRRHHRPSHTEPTRPRQRRGQQTARPAPISISTPTSSGNSPQRQCSAPRAKTQQTPLSGCRHDRPPQPPIQRDQPAAQQTRPVKAPVEREDAGNAPGDQGRPSPDVPDIVPCSRGVSPNLLGAGYHGSYWELSLPSGPQRQIDLLWQLVYHVTGRVRQ